MVRRPGRPTPPRPWLVALGCLAALVVARWSAPLALVAWLAWQGVVFRRPLVAWTEALRFDPRLIATTPALLAGLVICLGLLLLALFPGRFAPFERDFQTRALETINGQVLAAPFPPHPPYWLGTDAGRHDLLSRLIFGTTSTLGVALCVVALRLALGSCLGWAAGWYQGSWGEFALTAIAMSAAIPALLFAWVFIVAIGPGAGFAVFVLGLGLTGWAPWAQLLNDETRRLRREPYMEAAEAVGVPPQRQLSHYIVPNLLPLLIATAAQEMAAALLLLAELGFLGVFFGNGTVINPGDLAQGSVGASFNDWAGMLAGTRFEVFRNWWLPLAPAGAFLVAILGFTLLGTGLRQVLERPSRRGRRGSRRGTGGSAGKQDRRSAGDGRTMKGAKA